MPRRDGRIEPGQKLSKAVSARAWNRAQDAADIVLSGRYGVSAAGPTSHSAPYTWVYAKNSSATTIDRWAVMKIDGMQVAPTADDTAIQTAQFQSMPVLKLAEASAGEESICVAVEPILAGAVGKVAVAGAVQIKAASLSKASQAKILWQDANWAMIVLGGGAAVTFRFGSFAGTWRKDFGFNLKTVTLLRPNSDTESPLFLPETNEAGQVVQVTGLNLLAHIPAISQEVQRYCMVKKVGKIEGIPSNFGDIWLLVSGEC